MAKNIRQKDEKILKEDIKRVLFDGKNLGLVSKKNSEEQNKKIKSLYDDDIKKIDNKN